MFVGVSIRGNGLLGSNMASLSLSDEVETVDSKKRIIRSPLYKGLRLGPSPADRIGQLSPNTLPCCSMRRSGSARSCAASTKTLKTCGWDSLAAPAALQRSRAFATKKSWPASCSCWSETARTPWQWSAPSRTRWGRTGHACWVSMRVTESRV